MMEQLCILKQVYYQMLERLYTHQFRLQLTAVMNRTRDKKYDDSLQMIEILSPIIEMSLMYGNAKRVLRYCAALDQEIYRLEMFVKKDFQTYIDGVLF